MRFLFSLTVLAFSALPAASDDFPLPFPLTDATVFPEGALVTHSAELDLPPGAHRLLLPAPEYLDDGKAPFFDLPGGLRLRRVSFADDVNVEASTLYTQPQARAFAAVETAQQNLKTAQAKLRATQHRLDALQAQLGFITSISAENAKDVSLSDLRSLGALLRDEAVATMAEMGAERDRLEVLDQTVQAQARALQIAKVRFATLSAPREDGYFMVLDVVAAEPVSGALTLHTTTSELGWATGYRMHLTTGPDPALKIERTVTLTSGKIALPGTRVTLSTASPGDALSPGWVGSGLYRIEKPRPAPAARDQAVVAGAPEPMIEPEIIQSGYGVELPDGIVATYVFEDPVTLPEWGVQLFALAPLQVDAEVQLITHPRSDRYAFMKVNAVNTTGEILLPGQTQLLRDGTPVGFENVSTTPAGAEFTLGFGPMKQILVSHDTLGREMGDTGLVTRSETQTESRIFSVTNLMDTAQTVRAIYSLPFSEQEDLRITNRTKPNPDQIDVDDNRNRASWDLVLQPGEVRAVTIDTSVQWPEGYELRR